MSVQAEFEDVSIFQGMREWRAEGIWWRAQRDGECWKVSRATEGGFVFVGAAYLPVTATPREIWGAVQEGGTP